MTVKKLRIDFSHVTPLVATDPNGEKTDISLEQLNDDILEKLNGDADIQWNHDTKTAIIVTSQSDDIIKSMLFDLNILIINDIITEHVTTDFKGNPLTTSQFSLSSQDMTNLQNQVSADH